MIRSSLFALIGTLLISLLVPVAVFAGDPYPQTIYVDNGLPTEFDESEWHWLINGIDNSADFPAHITVVWSDGNSSIVYLDTSTPQQHVAHYRSTEHLDDGIMPTRDTWTTISCEYTRFNLSHGPSSMPPPAPELPAGILLGLGMAAIGTVIIVKRRSTFAHNS